MPFADGHAPLTHTHAEAEKVRGAKKNKKQKTKQNNQVEYDDDDAITLFSSMCHLANICIIHFRLTYIRLDMYFESSLFLGERFVREISCQGKKREIKTNRYCR